MRSSFPSNGVRARGCVVFPRICRVRTRVHNARGWAPVEEYIFSTGTPQAQMYSPNYLRIAVPHVPSLPRASLAAPQLFLPLHSLLSSPAHLHGMHSYEIDHSSADFSSGHFPSLLLSLFLPRADTFSPRSSTVYVAHLSVALFATR